MKENSNGMKGWRRHFFFQLIKQSVNVTWGMLRHHFLNLQLIASDEVLQDN